MNKRSAFNQIIANFISKDLDSTVSRAVDVPIDVPKIVSLLGPRRAGKTHVLLQIIKKLRLTIPADRLIYINFEDDRLFPMTLQDMDDLMVGYYEMYPENKDHQVWFFFDEIQEVPNWEKFVRRIDDTENCRIYLTGSSSKLLSRELASVLRGRSISYEILPLSFKEYLHFKQVEIDVRSSKGQAHIKNNLASYLAQGGFPELVFLPKEIHNKVISEYLDLMIYRDLTERFSLSHPQLVKYLLKHILVNISNRMSISKIFNDIKSQGYAVGKNTVYDYVEILEEAFILFKVQIKSDSIRKKAVNPSKFYCIDPAFKYAMSTSLDVGRVIENLVFMHLYRQGVYPDYLQHKQEVDFYWDDGQLVNVCYDYANASTKKREVGGLIEAMKVTGLKESYIVNWESEETIVSGQNKIHAIPLWKYLLDAY